MRVELRLLNPAAIALAWCLAVPPRVAGQAPPGARELAPLGSTLTVRAYGFADLTNPANARASTGPPPGLRVSDTLYPLLQRMWRGSPAFRRQCAQLDDARIPMSVHLGLPRGRSGFHALTQIEVQAGVIRHATVYLEPPLLRAFEFLAHEIEHVLEQIDGVNLRVLAINGVHGVHRGRRDAYETSRAVAIGRLVAREVSGYGRETEGRQR